MSRRTKWITGLAAALLAFGPVSACASQDSPASGESEETPSASGPEVLDVTISGDDASPLGKRVQVGVGQTLEVNIEADAAGELHVHSKPEQEVEYDAGESTHELTFDKPGVFPMESHDLGKVLVTLEVR
ncbi:MAG: hypothetical protein L0H93_01975 [Nocardioides sp.]|nr:hypothetical protein [Nocardioides sp.]